MCLPAPPPGRPSVNDCGHFRPRSPSSFNLDFFYFQRVVPNKIFCFFFLRILLFLAEVNGPLPSKPPSTVEQSGFLLQKALFFTLHLRKICIFRTFFFPPLLRTGGVPPLPEHTHTPPRASPPRSGHHQTGRKKLIFHSQLFRAAKFHGLFPDHTFPRKTAEITTV